MQPYYRKGGYYSYNIDPESIFIINIHLNPLRDRVTLTVLLSGTYYPRINGIYADSTSMYCDINIANVDNSLLCHLVKPRENIMTR